MKIHPLILLLHQVIDTKYVFWQITKQQINYTTTNNNSKKTQTTTTVDSVQWYSVQVELAGYLA